MPGTRLERDIALSRPDPATGGTGVVAEALTERRRLTDRDLTLIDLMHEHDVLTGDQIARLHFTSASRARHRLLELTRRRVVARFRRRLDRGSQHWRYTLGPVGATLHAAAHADPLPRAAASPWQSPESMETSDWRILVPGPFFEPGSGGGLGVPPAAGVNVGRRPPAGLGVDPGEDGATLGSRKRADHAACSGGSSGVLWLRS